jgi:hypothetical protein
MIHTILRFWFFATFLTIAFAVSPSDANAQRSMDKEVRQTIRFARGANSAVIRKRISVGYTHLYTLRAEEGQTMTVILTTGNQTSFTIYSPSDGIIDGADGETMWRGMLNESGEYLITIGTDAPANYTLEVYIK